MRVRVVAFAMLAGCGPAVQAPMGSGAGSAGSGPGSTGATGAGTSGGSFDPSAPVGTSESSAGTGDDGGSRSSTDASSSGSSSTGDNAPESICDPQPMGAPLVFLLDEVPLYDTAHREFEGACEIGSIDHDGELLAVNFSCGDEAFGVQLGTAVAPGLGLGDLVEVSLFVDVPWWGNGYVKVLRDGELMLAAMSAQGFPETVFEGPPADFFAPLSVSGRADLCEAEPQEEGCTRDQRQGIDFALEDAAATLVDRSAGTVGPLEVYVGRTVVHVEVLCSDTPYTWAEFVAIRP